MRFTSSLLLLTSSLLLLTSIISYLLSNIYRSLRFVSWTLIVYSYYAPVIRLISSRLQLIQLRIRHICEKFSRELSISSYLLLSFLRTTPHSPLIGWKPCLHWGFSYGEPCWRFPTYSPYIPHFWLFLLPQVGNLGESMGSPEDNSPPLKASVHQLFKQFGGNLAKTLYF